MASGVEGSPPLAGTLYLVATPIGNREDITLRALRLLREVAVIAAEDPRYTRALLTHYEIATPLMTYREGNRAQSAAAILERLRDADVALVSDAGLPLVSDPGGDLVAQVLAHGGRVEVVPGASAVLTALVGSGLPVVPFTFVGFLSRQRGDRHRQIEAVAGRSDTLVLYEAPHRVVQTLDDLYTVLGDRAAVVCRELTKRHEEMLRAPLSALRDHFMGQPPRGEFVLVVAGAPALAEEQRSDEATIDAHLRAAMVEAIDMRAALASLAAQSGWSRRALYARWQALRRQEP